jgi:hypothetical protein
LLANWSFQNLNIFIKLVEQFIYGLKIYNFEKT